MITVNEMPKLQACLDVMLCEASPMVYASMFGVVELRDPRESCSDYRNRINEMVRVRMRDFMMLIFLKGN